MDLLKESNYSLSTNRVRKGILITGMPGSGKTVLAELLKSRKIPTFSMGEAVFEETKKRRLKLTPDNITHVAKKLREELGEGAVAHLVIRKIESMFTGRRPSIIAVEGLRSTSELSIFKRFFVETVTVAVVSSQEVRYTRLKKRKRVDLESFEKGLFFRDLRELVFGLGELIANSDIYILNEGDDLAYFKSVCEKYIDKLLN